MEIGECTKLKMYCPRHGDQDAIAVMGGSILCKLCQIELIESRTKIKGVK